MEWSVKLEVPRTELQRLVEKQIDNLFFIRKEERVMLARSVDIALDRCEYCFSHTRNKYYRQQGQVYFNPFHSGQYSIFLYFVANSVLHLAEDNNTLADRVYYLNKCLNCLDIFYEVNMPKVFFLDHPVGTVLGRAVYGEYFRVTQLCTVGNNKGIYPVIGKNVKMMTGSTVLGSCTIGDNVIIAANSYVKDIDIPSCSIVFGSSPNLIMKRKEESYFKEG
jgi:serine O-acetyltransferase